MRAFTDSAASAARRSSWLRVSARLATARHLVRVLVWRNICVKFDATHLRSIGASARLIPFAVVFGFFRNLSGANIYVDVPYVLSSLLLWLRLRPGGMLMLLPIVVLLCIGLALGVPVVSAPSIAARNAERVLAYTLTVGLWRSPVTCASEMTQPASGPCGGRDMSYA